ncbi:MAG: DNA internalization-related competence protein ComEC/Rec2, partial [Gammaproteobacteria bacterium]|nr:DNA internalization-related competence protein ComEC/Rec2 [Gammaproteobacteria bacterium]
IHATGYVVKSAPGVLHESSQLSLNAFRFRLKQHIEESCVNCNNTGLIQALAIGYRGSISAETQRLLKQTGTAHLIAVSGLHIGMISAVMYSLGLLLWSGFFYKGRLKRKELALLLAWTGGLCYSLLSGFELPAQRAMLMLTVVLLSLLLRSPFNLLHSLKSALVLVILFSPLAVLSESFWLTFSALMIIAFGTFLLQREPSRLKQMVIIQLLFSILFIPVSIFIFGQVHTASMAANLIAVPLVSLIIVPLNFILLMLFWLPQELLQVLYVFLDGLLDVLTGYLNLLQSHGLQAIEVAHIDGWKLVLLVIFAILLLLPKGLISRALLLMVLPPAVFWQQDPQYENTLKMTVLDVGMGTSIILQTAQHSLVYDFGPGNNKGYSLGEWVVLPYLQHEGITKPDRIVISHADQDHSGGLYVVQDELQGIPVITGTPREIMKKFPELDVVKNCHHMQSWVWDSVEFEFISDQPAMSSSKNNRSCVLKVTLNQNSILIAGDIEKKQEQKLILSDKEALKATVLVAPHHGSLTSSTAEFISSVAADQVIFTTGYLNRWKFPRPEIEQRYLKTGSQIMQTDQTGAIQLTCSATDCKITKYRQQYPRVWY